MTPQAANQGYACQLIAKLTLLALGNEDSVLKDALYREVMGVFLKRIEERKRGGFAVSAKSGDEKILMPTPYDSDNPARSITNRNTLERLRCWDGKIRKAL